MTPSAAQQRYWLGDSPPEISHLLAQAEFPGPDAADLLDRIGVAPGATVVGIGCAVLGILLQLRSPDRRRRARGGAGRRAAAAGRRCPAVGSAWPGRRDRADRRGQHRLAARLLRPWRTSGCCC